MCCVRNDKSDEDLIKFRLKGHTKCVNSLKCENKEVHVKNDAKVKVTVIEKTLYSGSSDGTVGVWVGLIKYNIHIV